MKAHLSSSIALWLGAILQVASIPSVGAAPGTKFCNLRIHSAHATSHKRSVAERQAMRGWHQILQARYAHQFDWKQAKNGTLRCKGKYTCQVSAAPCARFSTAEIARLTISKSCQTAGTFKRAKSRRCQWYAPWKFR